MPLRTPSRKKLGVLLLTSAVFLTGCGSQYLVLNPVGPVGREELKLIVSSLVLTAFVVLPVLALLLHILWRYRDRPGNTAPYRPDWSDSRTLEMLWWGIPIVIVTILGGLTVRTTFALAQQPAKNVAPLTVYVTSLDWKWLFQYPEQQIATVNELEIPAGVPVDFILTADAPINSFWVPQLGGQAYAMPGMATHLWLQADKPGTYYGRAANFTGKGFTDMAFKVEAVSSAQFAAWVARVKANASPLTTAGYQELKKPSVVGVRQYSSFPPRLFYDTVRLNGGRYMPWMTQPVDGSR